jgi:hypothetical protein
MEHRIAAGAATNTAIRRANSRLEPDDEPYPEDPARQCPFALGTNLLGGASSQINCET